MHREQTSILNINGLRLTVRYAIIYGHDEGWKLGKIYSIRNPLFGEVLNDLTNDQLEKVKSHVAEIIDRDNN